MLVVPVEACESPAATELRVRHQELLARVSTQLTGGLGFMHAIWHPLQSTKEIWTSRDHGTSRCSGNMMCNDQRVFVPVSRIAAELLLPYAPVQLVLDSAPPLELARQSSVDDSVSPIDASGAELPVAAMFHAADIMQDGPDSDFHLHAAIAQIATIQSDCWITHGAHGSKTSIAAEFCFFFIQYIV